MKSYSEIEAIDLFDHITKPKVLLVDVRQATEPVGRRALRPDRWYAQAE